MILYHIPIVSLLFIFFRCVQTESASTPISAGSLSGNGKTAQGGSCGSATCIAGNNLLWSCTEHKSVHARDISIGDSVRVAGKGNGDDICSEVYYVFQHKEESHSAIRFDVGSEDGWFSSFAVSYNHIVYVGTSLEVSDSANETPHSTR